MPLNIQNIVSAQTGQMVMHDGDPGPDCDDMGDIALGLRFADMGVSYPIAMLISNANVYSAPAAYAAFRQQGRKSVPIGAFQGSIGDSSSPYTQQVRDNFGVAGQTRSDFPDPTTVARTALASVIGTGKKVKYLVNGYLQNWYNLQISPADGISPLTGAELMTATISEIVAQDFDFPTSALSGDVNGSGDVVATKYVYENPVVPITCMPNTLGASLQAGPPDQASNSINLFRYAYSLSGATTTHSAWGMGAYLYLVFGLDGVFTYGGQNGSMSIDIIGDTVTWSASPSGMVSWLASSVPEQISRRLTQYLSEIA